MVNDLITMVINYGFRSDMQSVGLPIVLQSMPVRVWFSLWS